MKIKTWLLPSKTNKYHPHLLRPLGLSLIIAALVSINVLQNVTTAHSFQVLGVATNISASDVITLSNQERANNGLGPLAYNSKLTSAAEAKARDMFAKDYWAHNAPDGTTPWTFISNAGYVYVTAGENLAKDFDTSSGVVQGWMNSSGHRANILNTTYQDTGVAVMDGTLQGESTTLVVAMYGSTRAAAASSSPTKPTTTPSVAKKPTTTATAPKVVTPEPTTTSPVVQPAPAPQQEPTPAPIKPAAAAQPVSTGQAQARALQAQAVSIKQSRTWSQNATLFILCTLCLVSILKHTTVWRLRKRGLKHVWLRAHPVAQYSLLAVAIVANISAGVGVIR